MFPVVDGRGALHGRSSEHLFPVLCLLSPAAGEIQADGTYVLTTYSQGDGATIGGHKVMIISERDSSELPAESAAANQDLSLIPEKYSMSPKTSGLTAIVEEGDNEINFDLK